MEPAQPSADNTELRQTSLAHCLIICGLARCRYAVCHASLPISRCAPFRATDSSKSENELLSKYLRAYPRLPQPINRNRLGHRAPRQDNRSSASTCSPGSLASTTGRPSTFTRRSRSVPVDSLPQQNGRDNVPGERFLRRWQVPGGDRTACMRVVRRGFQLSKAARGIARSAQGEIPQAIGAK